MRRIDYIVVHCTATPQNTTIESIQRHWRNVLGWKNPGYHYIIEADGKVTNLQPLHLPSNGVAGHNANSVHLSYIGGLQKDDRTPEQKRSMLGLIRELQSQFASAKVRGHKDFPGVTKACPNFDVNKWLEKYGTI